MQPSALEALRSEVAAGRVDTVLLCFCDLQSRLQGKRLTARYDEAAQRGYRDLHPANLYNIDCSILGTSRVEPLIRRISNEMTGAGLRVENSKGECNFGPHEINFAYGPVLQIADEHTIYKNGAKEIADQEGMALTFIAKYDEREDNPCHIHISLRDGDDRPVFAENDDLFAPFLAGQLATLREAADAFKESAVARTAFGEEVVEPYLNCTRVELEAFDAAVTDWELVRGFERL